jgi:signal transduction histidine kinase
MADLPREQFRVDPLVVFKLGEELISDETQALLELIKNAYDADASYVRVEINTHDLPDGMLLELNPERLGYIEVADDGTGMDRGAITDGWLIIARSRKRDFKRAGRVTAKDRTPLGDKGLGRLGTQRLGYALQIATKTNDALEERVLAFSWEDFSTAPTLDQVEIKSAQRSATRKHGTTLTIGELHHPERWHGPGLTDLQQQLSLVISPYEGISGFTVAVTVDGAPLDLQTINRQVRSTAQLHYDIAFDRARLTVEGRATLAFFRPASKNEQQRFADLVVVDDGARFFQHLEQSLGAEDFRFRRARGRWFVSFQRSRALADTTPALDEGGDIADPGPFRAEVDSFDLGPGEDERLEVFGGLKPYRQFVQQLAGIRVYRDGFNVRTDADWLRLGEQWTSASSYYGLKPATTIGYVAISSRDNSQLVEKTDREGFTDTPHYRTFQALMGDFLTFTAEVQSKLRREFLEFVKANTMAAAEVEPEATPESVSDAIGATLEEASEMRRTVAVARGTLEKAIGAAEEVANDGSRASAGISASEVAERHERATAALRQALTGAQGTLETLAHYLGRVEVAQSRNLLLRDEVAALREQLTAGVEAMSLGLTAEALSHEMFNLADGLATRTQAIRRKLDGGRTEEPEIRRFIEYVRGTVGSLRKELGHFSPSLRYVRERREQLDVALFAKDIAGYYSERWNDRDITTTVSDKSSARFVVATSRGKLTQVFDNLFLNSGYWIGVAQSQGVISDGEITVHLHRPLITVSDNGPGIEDSVSAILFDPFVTRKPRGEGRGLGLFVVRQLLESEGASIELGPRRNADGRRYEFIINLASLLQDA